MNRLPKPVAGISDGAEIQEWATAPVTYRKVLHSDTRPARSRFVVALLLALLLHALLFVLIADLMRPRSEVLQPHQVIQLRLIDDSAPESAPQQIASPMPEPEPEPAPSKPIHDQAPVLVPAPIAAPPPAVVASVETQPDSPITAVSDNVIAEPGRATTEKIFRRDGSIVLPDPEGSRAITNFDSTRKIAPFTPNPMAHPSPLPYEPTMFEKDWAPLDETQLGAFVRKATATKSWDTEGGTRITCTSFLLFGGCGWGPAPRVTIEELKRMRVNPPMPRPLPSDEP